MDHIGENIRKIRLLLDIKQAVMAKMLNISVNSYGKIERNEVELKLERLTQIAEIFEIEPAHIINFKQFLNTIKSR